MPMQRPILIAGPTASGKSALAVSLARRTGGVVINADSMQVYRELQVLTARPSPEEEAQAPHRLYGHVPATETYSVARWIADVRGELAACAASGQRPIIVGGTGLYFKALTEGLSPIPDIPAEIRARWRQAAAEQGAAAVHRQLMARDPVMAARLAPGDSQRITRALEVLEATGRSLAAWQRMPGELVIAAEHAHRLLLNPSREWLSARCDRRFDLMIAAGALDEVRHLAVLQLKAGMPVLGALGVRPLLAHLAGQMPLEAAVQAGKLETRQYVKRQQTWLKRHMIAWKSVKLNENGEIDANFNQLIDEQPI
ncbi:MAG: tRNA (adenosine(37)-N6)-dimethylallyltransferase MiaA [Hyphomicrobiaceae bacterium]